MVVDQHGRGQGVAVTGIEVLDQVAFHAAPAIVLAALARTGLEIDLLAGSLADVTDEQIAARAVEAEAPRVAQAIGPDLVECGRVIDEGIVYWNRVGAARVHVDAQELAEQGIEALTVVVRVIGAAAVAGGDVEIAVRPEVQVTSVVVGEVLVELEDDRLTRSVGQVRVDG